MRRSQVTDSFGDNARRVMLQGFGARKSARAIQVELKSIGTTVTERTLQRRYAEWFQEQRRLQSGREYVENLVAAMKANNMQATEIITALATDQLIQNPDAFLAGEPAEVQRVNLEATKLQVKREELAIKKADQELKQKKFEAMQTKLMRIKEAAKSAVETADKSGEMSPEVRKKILEVYGLAA